MGTSSLFFTKLESGEKSLDMNLFPNKGTNSNHLTIFILKIEAYIEKILQIKIKIYVIKKFIVGAVSHCKLMRIMLAIKMNYSSYGEGKARFLILLRAGDIELNPGPEELLLVSQNCRGLKNNEKFKQLLNACHSIRSKGTKIIALQETHIEKSMLNYSWSGNFALTPSQGAKGGVITLLGPNTIVHEQRDIDSECHVLLTEVIANNKSNSLIIVNLHAPCPHNNEKLKFFEAIHENVTDLCNSNDNCDIIIMGDFNTTFWPTERINTKRSKKETDVALKISSMFKDLNLVDCWNKFESTMTWRHGEKMSRIDRIQWSASMSLQHESTVADWSLTTSDHSAVVTKLAGLNGEKSISRITRIDTSFLSNIELRRRFLIEIDKRMSQLDETTLDQHGKLEFLKVSIRSVAIEIATNYKKEMEAEFTTIKSEISFWQSAFERAIDDNFRNLAKSNLDVLTSRRDKYLNQRGKYLCERSKTKWYQEGERSTKYFLNINKAKNNLQEMSELLIDNKIIRGKSDINRHVEGFYSKLYERGDSKKSNESIINQFLNKMNLVPVTARDVLDSEITVDELYSTLKSCQDSAPGPDGIPYSLIKLTWKHFGGLLLNSWKQATETGQLTISHEQSYLRLLPKDGKDTRLLKNWRPITLSNCDFKIITKTLSQRLSKTVCEVVSSNQTAYIKDRQISDNLHMMLHTTENINTESMLVSLDAEKAFDSLEHWYIKEVLKKIGLGNFVKIFDLLYRDQKVDIILNGQDAGKYKIKNGVKQGDALSCILFILGIEPLLRNINSDQEIKGININSNNIPKAVAYADDVACIIKPEIRSLQGVFNHYDNLTKVSGLRLNADKTEIISSTSIDKFRVTYGSQSLEIQTVKQIKVNGIHLSYDCEYARKLNITNMLGVVESTLKGWTNRSLSLLGKIQIFKTFGLSQILYTLSVLEINKQESKKLTDIIYKYIWNRNMDANKAPDRIKRKILLTKISALGFGMIDYKEVIHSLRMKNMIRLLNMADNPLTNIIKSSISRSVIKVKMISPIREPLDSTIKLMSRKWLDCTESDLYINNSVIFEIICREFYGNLVQTRFRNQKLCRTHRNDTISEIINSEKSTILLNKIDPKIMNYIGGMLDTQHPSSSHISYDKFPVKGKLVVWTKITSKSLREVETKIPIPPKLVQTSDSQSLKKLARTIGSLTNCKLKSIILRCLHGDVYCRERMFRFGMTDDNKCSRCSQVETIEHMLFTCKYVSELWKLIGSVTGIKNSNLQEILGLNPIHDKVTLTIHAEILRRLLAIERPVEAIKDLLKSAVRSLSIVEKGFSKYQVKKILDHLEQT